jgi:predicted metal-dependent hydrolase
MVIMDDKTLTGSPVILIFVTELMMATRIESLIDKLNGQVLAATDLSEFDTNISPLLGGQPAEPIFSKEAKIIDQITNLQPGLMIFDLGDSRYRWREWIALFKSLPSTRNIPIICFGQHVDVETLEVARNIGADLVVARSRFVTVMPDLIVQNIRTWNHQAIAEDCNQPISQMASKGLIAFNNGDYFEAHEHLEDAWNDDVSASRDVYKAILQVAVAYLQIERRNYRGAMKMFIRARQWLHPLPNICRGIDIDRLRKDADEIYSMISELGPDRMDLFDFERLQPVSYTKKSFTESNNL